MIQSRKKLCRCDRKIVTDKKEIEKRIKIIMNRKGKERLA